MTKGYVASASVRIDAPSDIVWDALVNPETIRKYMFGTEVVSEWKEGSSIVWKGIWEGKPYEDKGYIIKKIPLKTLELSHFSPLSGIADIKENYHTLIFNLTSDGTTTTLLLTQDNNPDENAREHSRRNWEMMLQNLKKTVEGESPA